MARSVGVSGAGPANQSKTVNRASVEPKGAAIISDPDIWRAANMLIRKHGADAKLEAARLQDLMVRAG
jgi:hypothetical protein